MSTLRKMTPKQARFVEEYLIDSNATQAAIRAGYSEKTAEQQGYQLLQIPSVQAAVAEGYARHQERCEVTKESMADQFDEDRVFARQHKQPGAAVSASTGKAKLFGLLKDKHEHTGDGGGPIRVRPDLSKFTTEELETIERILGRTADAG